MNARGLPPCRRLLPAAALWSLFGSAACTDVLELGSNHPGLGAGAAGGEAPGGAEEPLRACHGTCFCSERAGVAYAFCKDRLPHADAAASCAARGLELARLEGALENAWVYELAYQAELGTFWIGASDATTPGVWTWRDGEVLYRTASAVGCEDAPLVIDGRCYEVLDEALDFARARAACVGRGSGWFLAESRSSDRDRALRELAAAAGTGAEGAWLQGSRASDAEPWRWLRSEVPFWSGGASGSVPPPERKATPAEYVGWAPEEPRGTGNRCLSVTQEGWQARDCADAARPLCERIGEAAPASYVNWAPDQPNDPVGRCAAIDTDGADWWDARCSLTLGYVCRG